MNDISRHTFPHPGSNDVINVTLQQPSFLRTRKSEYNPDANSIRWQKAFQACAPPYPQPGSLREDTKPTYILLFRRRSNHFGGSLAGNVNDEEKTWGLEFEAG